ncbi:putative solute-binding protein [Thalassolituus sp.]|uniref:putative solute-binding protein n=1 Tax=Thalassolituus sp. TaxID=2030822 RepID=UPI003519AEF3
MKAKILLASLFGLLFLSPAWAAGTSDDLESRRNSKLEATVMNPNLPLEKRIRALKKLQKDEMVDGRILRTFCVWDPLGKAGPISSTVDDQKLRSLHYGMDLTVITFQDENQLIEALRNESQCDAALIRGAAAMEFNRFAGTIEAVGALPDRQHLQLLMQVMANPRMAPRMSNGKYKVLGVATIGGTYAFVGDQKTRRMKDLKGKKVAYQDLDPAMGELIRQVGAVPVSGNMMANVQTYADGEVSGMVSPAIAYLVMGSGQISGNIGILKTPVAQSTIQLIGRVEKFPDGLAQILREDFLFKFENYAGRVDKEMSIVPSNFWMEDKAADLKSIEDIYLDVRLKLREEGYYDAAMLRLQRKIRCKFDPDRSECANPKE